MPKISVPEWSDVKQRYSDLGTVESILVIIIGVPALIMFINFAIAAMTLVAIVFIGAMVFKVLARVGSIITRKKG